MRFQKTRYIPKESVAVNQSEGLGVAYVYRIIDCVTSTSRGFGVIAYGGKRNTADFHYSYKTLEAAHKQIMGWFDGLKQHVSLVENYRKDRYAGHDFKVGDIVTNSWGYDQTNVDWYRVTKTTTNFVWLQEICAHETEQNGFMSGYSTPALDASSDNPADWKLMDKNTAPTKHQASKSSVSMKYGCGNKWDGKAKYESWYA